MKAATPEWVSKAEGDFVTMEREGRARRNPNYDAVCFHAQQCIEKYLKARILEEEIDIPKIHHLGVLLDMVLPAEPLWEIFREDLLFLTNFSVLCRYPGASASKETAKDARKRCKRFRRVARQSLGLSE